MNILFNTISRFKALKNGLLKSPVLYLSKKGVLSDHLTLLSFFTGITSVYFFAQNINIFIILITLSIIFDLLDGAFASVENKADKEKKRGMLLDDLSDRAVFFLLIIKMAYILSSVPVLLISLAYILIKSLHIILKQKYSSKIQILYFDRFSLLLLLFSYDLFFQVMVLVLFINILELINILQNKEQNS
jgi:phosphatidylglycerophosphate synthase